MGEEKRKSTGRNEFKFRGNPACQSASQRASGTGTEPAFRSAMPERAASMLNVLFLLPQLLVAPMCGLGSPAERRAPGFRTALCWQTPLNMGITDSHQEKLQAWVNKYNVALFVRVSDLTSVNLIDTDKFACKSVIT